MAHAARRSRDNFRIPALTDPPSSLNWISATLEHDLDVVGEFGLQLDAASTAPDTAWIVFLQDVNASGGVTDVTAGYLRASLREVDETARQLDAPVLLCRIFQAVPIGEMTRNRIPLMPNARRFNSGH